MDETRTRDPVTNGAFAAKVGVHFTMASRYRNGLRVPSTTTALHIVEAYGLDHQEMLEAIGRGAAEFGHYIRVHVFGPDPERDPSWPKVKVPA